MHLIALRPGHIKDVRSHLQQLVIDSEQFARLKKWPWGNGKVIWSVVG